EEWDAGWLLEAIARQRDPIADEHLDVALVGIRHGNRRPAVPAIVAEPVRSKELNRQPLRYSELGKSEADASCTVSRSGLRRHLAPPPWPPRSFVLTRRPCCDGRKPLAMPVALR